MQQLDLSLSFRQYLLELYEAHSREWAFHGSVAADLAQWQEETRPRLLALLSDAETQHFPLHCRRSLIEETSVYRHERLYYDTRRNLTATAQLLLPQGAKEPVPAVLCPPGHGGGMNQVLQEDGVYKRYPFSLVQRGLAALVPEHIGFGERVGSGDASREANHSYYFLSLNLLGESMLGFQLWDLMRALDVLQSLPEVDGERLGCYGLSLGGEMTMLLAACDTRVKAVVISGFLTSYRSTFLDKQHCGCGYGFGLARYLEHQDIAALIVPRPLVVESAESDPDFHMETARKSVDYLRGLYRLASAEDRLAFDAFQGEHEISGAIAFDWLCRWL